MKQFIKIMTVATAAIVIASCQKDTSANAGQTVEEQIAYMDAAGDEALSQIEPADFQKLADIIKDVSETPNPEFDEKSQASLMLMLAGMAQPKGIVINPEKITGTLTIDGETATYSPGEGLKIIYKSESDTYSADLILTAGTNEVKLSSLPISETEVDVYLVMPEKITANVFYNDDLYLGTDITLNCSSMPSDWSSLTPDKLNASLSGNIFLNGKGSYNADINNLKIENGKAEFNGTLCGNKGAFLASVDASANVIFERGESGWEAELDDSSVKIYGNLIDKIEARNKNTSGSYIYLAKSSTAQLTIDGEEETVTFADGTVNDIDEVFNENNFPKTYNSGKTKFEQFAEMFDL